MNGATVTSPTVVVLAAGASARLGRPKALVELGGRSVLEALIAAASTRGQRLLVVGGAHHAAIAEHVDHILANWRHSDAPSIEVLHNREWNRGRTSSVQCAVLASPGTDLVIAPVDVPRVPAAVFAALRRAWSEAGAPARGWLAPAVVSAAGERRFGHPVLIGRDLAAGVLDGEADRPLSAWRAEAAPLLCVDVADPRILEDLDTPADLVELERRSELERD